jgi:hypothetical protein
LKRRDFLRGAALVAAGAGTGVGASLLGEGEARAFGEVPRGAEGASVPANLRAENILEIFLYGGLSHYESFYCVEEYGQTDGTGWHLFLKSGDIQKAVTSCGFSGPLLQDFALDDNGKMVKFGPFVMPLRNRPDVMDRVRVSITKHDLEPHEGAIPLALAGRNLGHPALAGLGSHIQRYFFDRNTVVGRAPFSYVLLSTGLIATDNIRSATAIGLHPGAARPLSLKVDAAGDITALLARGTVGANRANYDKLMDGYIQRYNERLRWKDVGPLRAPRLGDLSSSADSIASADSISAVLEPQYFTKFSGKECGNSATVDTIAMNLKLATHLLTHPTESAKYVCVVDSGLIPADGGGGYDTHGETPHTQARNLSHTLKTLMSLINTPGEGNPNKLDLDKTMIVITTEFGRTPFAQGSKGRNHWPYGYPITFIGGPIRAGGKGVCGATGPDAVATPGSSTPQENRIAALLALGIWPFAQESYNVADVPGTGNEIQAATLVKSRQLGITS